MKNIGCRCRLQDGTFKIWYVGCNHLEWAKQKKNTSDAETAMNTLRHLQGAWQCAQLEAINPTNQMASEKSKVLCELLFLSS